jgi:hypothetical protein
MAVWIIVAVGIALVVVFGLRTVRSGPRVPRPGQQSPREDVDALRGWMTIPMIADHYAIPEEILFAALDIPPEQNRALTLRELNSRYWPDQPGLVMTKLQDALRERMRGRPGEQPRPP